MADSNRKRKPQTKRNKGQLRNLNRIVRVRSNKLNHFITAIAYQLGCPYQLVFEEWCEMMMSGYTHGFNTGDLLIRRMLEKYTGDSNV